MYRKDPRNSCRVPQPCGGRLSWRALGCSRPRSARRDTHGTPCTKVTAASKLRETTSLTNIFTAFALADAMIVRMRINKSTSFWPSKCRACAHVHGNHVVNNKSDGKWSFSLVETLLWFIGCVQTSLQPVQIYQAGAEEERAETARLVRQEYHKPTLFLITSLHKESLS